MHAYDWEIDCEFVCVCVCLCVYLYVRVIGSSYVFHLSRYWGEWQGVKLKLHPLSEHHNPHLCSSSAGLPIKKIQTVCVCACVSMHLRFCGWKRSGVYACMLETVGVFSPSISKQYSFESWQLQIAHIMTSHGRLALQSHKLNTSTPPFIHPSIPPLTLLFIPFFFLPSPHIYLFISYWRGKGWIGVILWLLN